MKTENRTRVTGARYLRSYPLGTYRFYWVAWLRAFAHIMRTPGREVHLDRIKIVKVKTP